ncbi:radial spoke head protein 9 homolog [Culicoides brevitarsis]|uniref:radial spoke head protein 9 homolog n=1 Tax=Culicoides brevitarsis TaxID=469753 RepID=UPI00307C9618
MDVSKFHQLLPLLPYSGNCLSPEESILIETSLNILKNDKNFTKIYFWGKILTISGHDYYIAFGFYEDCLRNRQFFYSQNMLNWQNLPKINESTYEISLMYQKMFQGDPESVVEVEMPPEFLLENDRIEQKLGEKSKLKEEDRLACVVQIISHQTMIVPRGAICNDMKEIVKFNENFQGLTKKEAGSLENYQFYREPVNEYNFNLLKRENFNYSTDFLDTLDDLVPRNRSFAVTFERDDEKIVVLRSLHWMGATFLHEIESSLFVFAYFGDGKMNHDLLFML